MEVQFDALSFWLHGWTRHVLQGVLFGLVLTALVFLATRLVRSLNAATRFALWWSTLVLVIGLAFVPGVLHRAAQSARGFRPPAAASAPAKAPAAPTARTARTEPVRTDIRQPPHPPDTPESPVPWPLRPTRMLLRAAPLLLWPGAALIAGLLLLRLGSAYWKIRRMIAGSQAFVSAGGFDMDGLMAEMGIPRRVRLRTTAMIDYPMVAAFGPPVILLPESLSERLGELEMKQILVHEMAHLRRRDVWTKPIQMIVQALCFFHPAVHWIGRQLDLECEMACDDEVLARIGRPLDYARCLLRLADDAGRSRSALLPCMALRGRAILRRFESILRPREANPAGIQGRRLTAVLSLPALALLASLFMSPILPAPFAPLTFAELRRPHVPDEQIPALVGNPEQAERPIDWSLDYNNLDLSFTLRTPDGSESMYTIWSTGREGLHAGSLGEVVFTLSGGSVQSLSPGGFLCLCDRRGEGLREIDVRPGPPGQLRYDYFVGGLPRPLDAEGEEWLRASCALLTGIIDDGAGERAAALEARAGLPELLREVPRLRRQTVRQIYLSQALADPDLQPEGLRAILESIGSALDRPDGQGALLMETVPRIRRHPELTTVFGSTLQQVEDESERRRLLLALARNPDPEPTAILASLHLAEGLLSDRHRSKLVSELASACVHSGELYAACRRLASGIADRSYREGALESLELARKAALP